MIDRGSGAPVVLIPGLQGRWEWMAPTVDALAERCRVLSFSLSDEPTSGAAVDERAGFDAYLQQVEDALQRAKVEQAILIGVSYSGLIATEFACRYPHRVRGLVLVSALPPGWQPNARARFYMRAPLLLAPVFAVTSPMRMFPELRAALRTRARVGFMMSAVGRALLTRVSPSRMARRVRWIEGYGFSDAAALQIPALVVTGEDHLDRIVAPTLTRKYLELWPHARYHRLAATGHIGSVTKAADFALVVSTFANEIGADAKRISA
jgi:pimeloyl-ACP methyl ester carboxylesterase